MESKDEKSDKTVWRVWYERMRLPMAAPLEAAFRDHQRNHAISVFRVNIMIISVIYMLVGWGIYTIIPEADLHRWLALFGGIGGVIVMAATLSWVPRFDRWFHVYVGIASGIAVALSVMITGVQADPATGPLTQATLTYCLVIIYGMVGLRLSQALLAGWLGGVVGVLMADISGGQFNWGLSLVTFGGSNILGMCLAYYAEYHSRAMFLLQLNQIDKLEHLVSEDPLTGLSNRRYLDKAMAQEWLRASRQQQPLAVVMIDIDRFKAYNDYYGHVAGDTCLRTISAIIAHYARRPGDVAARYGGEEFALLLPNMELDQAMAHVGRMLREIRAAELPHAPAAGRPFVTVSIGVAVTTPVLHRAPETLVDLADHAMYEAKHEGGDRYRFAEPRLMVVGKGAASKGKV